MFLACMAEGTSMSPVTAVVHSIGGVSLSQSRNRSVAFRKSVVLAPGKCAPQEGISQRMVSMLMGKFPVVRSMLPSESLKTQS